VTAHSAVDIVAQMRTGHRVILPLQVAVTEDDWPGLETVLGLPVDVDMRGWHRTMAIHLAIDERKALEVAAAAVNERLEAWQSKATMGATA
jgi:malate/lactate dehydrogenase